MRYIKKILPENYPYKRREKGRHDIYVSFDDFQKMLDKVRDFPFNNYGSRDYMILLLMGNLGLRRGEVVLCEPKHFLGLKEDPPIAYTPSLKKREKNTKDQKEKETEKRENKKKKKELLPKWWVPKTKYTKDVFVHPKVAEVILNYIENEVYKKQKYLFPGHQGDGHLSPKTVERVFNTYVKLCDIDHNYTTHSLRHMVGTKIYQETRDMAFVRDQMGHALVEGRSTATTNIYVHTDLSKVKEYLKAISYFI